MAEYIFDKIKDMNLTHVFECGQCFRWNALDDGRYLGIAGGYACIAELDEKNGILRLTASGGSREFWYEYFDLGTDYGAVRKMLSENSPELEHASDCCYGIRILKQDLFEALISFIISQNNNIPRIKKCIEAICERFGEKIVAEDPVFSGFTLYSFPSAEALAKADTAELMELKLGYRSEYILRAAARFLEEGAPSNYDEVLAYHGIGPKVANCIELFGLRNLSAFPIDTWIKKIMSELYGFAENDVKAMQAFAEKNFGEYGGIAQQYLFYWGRSFSK